MSLVLPAVVYGEGSRTALKAAIRWQGSLELFLPFQNIYFEQLPHFVFRREKFRSWQQLRRGDFDYMLRDTYCTGQELAFLWQPAQKRERVCLFLLNLHLKGNKRRKKQSSWMGRTDFCSFPSPITSVSITPRLKRARRRRDTAESFYADEKRLMGEGGGSRSLRSR